jgi:hypothetical protein
MRQEIINTPQDSGLGDTLFVAFNKVNAMTLELYNQDSQFESELQTIQSILDTINDGVSTLNHKHTISQIIGLQTALNSKVSTTAFNSQIVAINQTIQQINVTIGVILDELQTKISDAPSDGTVYGRKDGQWTGISQPDLSVYVPYTGATQNVDLGTYSIKADNFSSTNSSQTSDAFLGLINDKTELRLINSDDSHLFTLNSTELSNNLNDGSSESKFIQNANSFLFDIDTEDFKKRLELEEGATTIFASDSTGNFNSDITQTDTRLRLKVDEPDLNSSVNISSTAIDIEVSKVNEVNTLLFDFDKLQTEKYVEAEGFRGNYVYYDTDYVADGNESQGAVYWNADRQTLQLKMNGTNYDYGMGLFFYVKNQSGIQINKGDVVGFAGTLGMSGIILGAKYVNDGSQPSDRLMGVAKENIPNGGEGKVVFFGEIRGINTNSFTAGTILYASNVTAGALSSTVPNAGTNKGEIAAVVSQSSTVGTIFVRALTSKRLNEVDDVSISGATNGQALVYDNGIWKNGRNQYDVFPFNIKDNFFGLHLIPSYVSTSTLSSSANNTNRRVIFYPMVLNNITSINTMSVLHNAANDGADSTLTLYIYDDSNDGLPGIKLYQEISATGIFTTAQKEIPFTGFTQSLPAGNYWVGLHSRDLNTAGTNPTFIGGNLTRISTGASTLTYTNNSNISYTVPNQTADLGNNPTLTRTSSTVFNDPQIFIKLNT